MLIPAIAMPLRLSLREATNTVLMLGGCHGFVHGLDVGRSRSLWFGLGAAVTAPLKKDAQVIGPWLSRPAALP